MFKCISTRPLILLPPLQRFFRLPPEAFPLPIDAGSNQASLLLAPPLICLAQNIVFFGPLGPLSGVPPVVLELPDALKKVIVGPFHTPGGAF